ncbi:hypothetical protein ACFFOT_01650 [Cardiobacterium valvarum]
MREAQQSHRLTGAGQTPARRNNTASSHHEAESHHARTPVITPLAGRRAGFSPPNPAITADGHRADFSPSQQHSFIFIMKLKPIMREAQRSRCLAGAGQTPARRNNTASSSS